MQKSLLLTRTRSSRESLVGAWVRTLCVLDGHYLVAESAGGAAPVVVVVVVVVEDDDNNS